MMMNVLMAKFLAPCGIAKCVYCDRSNVSYSVMKNFVTINH